MNDIPLVMADQLYLRRSTNAKNQDHHVTVTVSWFFAVFSWKAGCWA